MTVKKRTKSKTFMLRTLDTAIALSSYLVLLTGTQTISSVNSPKITSQNQLEQMLETEKKRLNCDKPVVAKLCDYDVAQSKKNDKSVYEIDLGGKCSTLSTLRHELYHIADGHLDEQICTNGRYLFWEEPQATMYEAFGLRL